ncbi:hypothetical protein AB1I63_07945 [Streptococcus pneumoniae]
MKFKHKLVSLLAVTTLSISFLLPVFSIQSVYAAELNKTSDKYIPETIDEIPDNQSVIALPEGGVIINRDGSSDFSEEEVTENQGVVMTAKEVKEQNLNSDLLAGSELVAIGNN